jgi:hypothetical protein
MSPVKSLNVLPKLNQRTIESLLVDVYTAAGRPEHANLDPHQNASNLPYSIISDYVSGVSKLWANLSNSGSLRDDRATSALPLRSFLTTVAKAVDMIRIRIVAKHEIILTKPGHQKTIF